MPRSNWLAIRSSSKNVYIEEWLWSHPTLKIRRTCWLSQQEKGLVTGYLIKP